VILAGFGTFYAWNPLLIEECPEAVVEIANDGTRPAEFFCDGVAVDPSDYA
jgi:hypothetical protein